MPDQGTIQVAQPKKNILLLIADGQYGLAGKQHHFVIFDNITTSPAFFRDNGYLTGLIGKIHVGPYSAYPWHVQKESSTRDVAWVADQAEEFFEQATKEEKPFFLTVGYIDPHRDMTRSGFGNQDIFDARTKDVPYDPASVEVPPYINNLEESRFEYSEYYRAISRLDQGVGFILEKLRASGVRLPFIVRCPGAASKGIENPNMVSYVDIFPTFLDWAGLSQKAPKGLAGVSILPIIDKTNVVPESEWKHHVFGSHTFHEPGVWTFLSLQISMARLLGTGFDIRNLWGRRGTSWLDRES
ncbi:putative N-sulfoglucosamine sulfohydrolase [Glarea lozoyensis 74030]|uniref:Putative N-sulfoglucosamine sulfohydrolase n=1 Tax=Glarea lozoyensis (strain ATCC 74030 / MF5533) TaxID=1104152 RepID=H0ETG5_GLAL7|nr:putative N-sulfoglucosamine sulfohydrolase [Glarea lozoyensis 74030]